MKRPINALRRFCLPACAVLALGQAPARAETLQSESVAVLRTSPALASERARLDAARQALPLAWSEAMPQITLDGTANEHDQSERRVSFTVRDQPEYWVASIRTSLMLFGSGRVLSSTRQARAQILGALARYQDAAQAVLLDLTTAYGQTRFAQARLSAQEELLTNLQRQAEFAHANRREGFLTNTDVAQADARVALARAQLAEARAQMVEATEVYTRITGHSPSDLSSPHHLAALPADLDAALADADANHPALLGAIAQLEQADASIDVAASSGRPRVDLQTNYSRFDAIGGSLLTEQWDNTVSVRVTIPLITGGAVSARTTQQRAVRRSARYDLEETRRRVRERATIAWTGLAATRERLDASRLGLAATELASEGARLEQQYGQRSMIDVLNQEQELISARIAVARAELDTMVAERTLAASIGQLVAALGEPDEPAEAEAVRPHRRPRSHR